MTEKIPEPNKIVNKSPTNREWAKFLAGTGLESAGIPHLKPPPDNSIDNTLGEAQRQAGKK